MIIRLTIPANEAKMVAPLSIVFGQHQLPGPKLCLEFNKLSNNFLAGIPLNVIIEKSGSEFSLQLRPPSISFFIEQLIVNKTISITELYDIFIILKNFFPNESDLLICKRIFSNLKSFKVFIKF